VVVLALPDRWLYFLRLLRAARVRALGRPGTIIQA
jgi:hypothetical protein